MAGLPQPVLHAKLRAALPVGTTFSTSDETRPADAKIPRFGIARIYLWTVTHVESSDRPPDEFKIQLILPGQTRKKRGTLEMSRKESTFLLGYSPDYGVFVGWEARLHSDFSFSAAVQVKEVLLDDARSNGWAVAKSRRVEGGEEIRVAFTPGNLYRYLVLTKAADKASHFGNRREAFFLAHTPNVSKLKLPGDTKLGQFIMAMRRKIIVERFERDAKFGPLIKKQFDFACAVCGTQLEIVEGAHIIPVSVQDSKDEMWNGIALCPNHHKLFDACAFIITPNFRVMIDNATIEFFRESHRDGGLRDALTSLDARNVRKPLFFTRDERLQRKMFQALQWRQRLAAIDR
jgi:putative restriction endonuclease